MRRRRFIGLGAAGMISLAGCPSQSGRDSEPSPTDDESSETPSQTATATAAATPTETPTPTAARFELRDLQYPENLTVGDTPEIRVEVENTGGVSGAAVITLFWTDSATKKTIELQPNTRGAVTFNPEPVASDGPLTFRVIDQSDSSIQGEIQVTGRNILYVGPGGADDNPGTKRSPLGTIQHALERATPGDTIHVKPGNYTTPIETVRAGRPGEPITLTGPPDARLAAGRADGGAMSSIRHSHIHITGLTFDGLINPDKPNQASSYQLDPLIDVVPEFSSDEYLHNVRISPHGVGNARGAMINPARIKDSEIGPFRVIGPAGLEWKLTDKEGHLGEIVYLGTDPTNLGKDWHPWTENDKTSNIRVHHIDNSEGYAHSRLVQTKPGVHDLTIEYCTDGGGTEIWREGTSSSVFFECHQATIRWCLLKDGDGAGITIGSPWAQQDDATEAERKSGSMNSAFGNRIIGFDQEALWFKHSQGQADQENICGNEYSEPTDGDPDKACPTDLPSGDGVGHLGGNSPWV